MFKKIVAIVVFTVGLGLTVGCGDTKKGPECCPDAKCCDKCKPCECPKCDCPKAKSKCCDKSKDKCCDGK